MCIYRYSTIELNLNIVCMSVQNIWIFITLQYHFADAAAKSLQACLTLCNPIDGNPTRLPPPWDSPGKNTGVVCHFLLQYHFSTISNNYIGICNG